MSATKPNGGSGERASVNGGRAALWASAFVLGAMVLLHAGGLLDRPARAEMTATSGGYRAVTTNVGAEEALFVVDEPREKLLVYLVRSNRRLDLVAQADLPDLFTRAQAQASGRP